MSKITTSYNEISAKTTLLNELSEQLYIDQSKLQQISTEINKKLHYFTSATQLSQMLSLSSLSVSSTTFFETLEKVDTCIEYMIENVSIYSNFNYCTKEKFN